jgi:uncharacterized membrane protein YkvA (DUF1232 family)
VWVLFALFNLLRIRGIASIILKLPQYLRLSWRLLWDHRTPGKLKMWVLLAIVYAISPLDFIPDFILPIVGYGEDLILTPPHTKQSTRVGHRTCRGNDTEEVLNHKSQVTSHKSKSTLKIVNLKIYDLRSTTFHTEYSHYGQTSNIHIKHTPI